MELWQYQKNDLEFVALPVTADGDGLFVFSCCFDDLPMIFVISNVETETKETNA